MPTITVIKKRAPPTDQAAKETTQRCCEDERQCSATLKQGDGLGEVRTRRKTCQNSGRQRPKAANRHTDQGSTDEKDEEVWSQSYRQTRDDEYSRIEQDDQSSIQLCQEGVAEKTGKHGEESRDGDGLPGLPL